MSVDDREFQDRARERDLGDPATDLPLTLRVYPDDDPSDPSARRVVKVGQDDSPPWLRITGGRSGMGYDNAEVADWPYTSGTVAGAAFLPPDQHRTFKFDGLDGVAECSCGVLGFNLRDRTHAGHWHATHRKATPLVVERGDMGVEAFKGGCHWCTTNPATRLVPGPCQHCGAVPEGATR